MVGDEKSPASRARFFIPRLFCVYWLFNETFLLSWRGLSVFWRFSWDSRSIFVDNTFFNDNRQDVYYSLAACEYWRIRQACTLLYCWRGSFSPRKIYLQDVHCTSVYLDNHAVVGFYPPHRRARRNASVFGEYADIASGGGAGADNRRRRCWSDFGEGPSQAF